MGRIIRHGVDIGTEINCAKNWEQLRTAEIHLEDAKRFGDILPTEYNRLSNKLVTAGRKQNKADLTFLRKETGSMLLELANECVTIAETDIVAQWLDDAVSMETITEYMTDKVYTVIDNLRYYIRYGGADIQQLGAVE